MSGRRLLNSTLARRAANALQSALVPPRSGALESYARNSSLLPQDAHIPPEAGQLDITSNIEAIKDARRRRDREVARQGNSL